MATRTLADDLNSIRSESPLVHNITNYVVMNWTANCLLSAGASPVMAHALDEVEAMVAIARSLVVNIGTLSPPWVESMEAAMKAARARGIPIVLDPVGAGATEFRTEAALRLLRSSPPTVIRGNASEILALAGHRPSTKGVDSTDSADSATEAAQALSRRYGCVACVSGPTDLIVGQGSICFVSNGHPLMTRITGMGCAASAMIGAFLAVHPSPLLATAHAMTLMGVAGELAAAQAQGPGSFQPAFLDHLYRMDPMILSDRRRMRFSA